MLSLIVIAIVLLAIFDPAFLASRIFWIASPFIAIWIIVKIINAIHNSIEDWKYTGGHHSINIGSINMFNKNTTYNSNDSHDNYSFRK